MLEVYDRNPQDSDKNIYAVLAKLINAHNIVSLRIYSYGIREIQFVGTCPNLLEIILLGSMPGESGPFPRTLESFGYGNVSRIDLGENFTNIVDDLPTLRVISCMLASGPQPGITKLRVLQEKKH